MRYSWIIPIIFILFLLPLSNAQIQSQLQFNVQGIPSTYAVENSSINIIIYYYDSNNNLIQEVSYTIPFAFSFYLNLNYSSNVYYFKISYPELTAFYNSLEINLIPEYSMKTYYYISDLSLLPSISLYYEPGTNISEVKFIPDISGSYSVEINGQTYNAVGNLTINVTSGQYTILGYAFGYQGIYITVNIQKPYEVIYLNFSSTASGSNQKILNYNYPQIYTAGFIIFGLITGSFIVYSTKNYLVGILPLNFLIALGVYLNVIPWWVLVISIFFSFVFLMIESDIIHMLYSGGGEINE